MAAGVESWWVLSAAHLVVLHYFVICDLHRHAVWAQWGVQDGVLIHVGDQDRLADGGFVVQPGTSVTMAAGPGVTKHGRCSGAAAAAAAAPKSKVPCQPVLQPLSTGGVWVASQSADHSPNLEVEGTVHTILFCPKDGGKVFSHAAGHAAAPFWALCGLGLFRRCKVR